MSCPGLGWFDAEVKKFDLENSSQMLPLPHMGWNDVTPVKTDALFRELESGTRFYFLHSYYFSPANIEDVLSETDL